MIPAEGRADVLATLERAVEHEPEADEILRQGVVVLYEWITDVRSVAIAFVEDGTLATGPIAGDPIEQAPSVAVPVLYEDRPVAELWIVAEGAPDDDERAFLGRVANVLSPYCLVGWDTGGEAWEP
ncbi:MAG TPA: hypothetical protein VGF46_03605 [Gaiellales bacterium]